MMLTMPIIVLGKEFSVLIISALLLFLCMSFYFFLFLYLTKIMNKCIIHVCLIHFLYFVSRNLSNLNLGGEISTAIGDLRDLQSMYGYVS